MASQLQLVAGGDKNTPLPRVTTLEGRAFPLDQTMENSQDEAVYQCGTCQYVLKQKRDDPPPSYCPRCAVNQLKGAMLLVFRETEHAGGSGS